MKKMQIRERKANIKSYSGQEEEEMLMAKELEMTKPPGTVEVEKVQQEEVVEEEVQQEDILFNGHGGKAGS